MNASALVIFGFAIWSVLCWNWYVCGIKAACDTKVQTEQQIIAPAIEPDTAGLIASQLPQSVSTKPLQYSYASPEEERVQIIQYFDRVEIHFPYHSIEKEENEAVDEYLSYLAGTLKSGGGKVTLEGHADFVGGPKYNYNLALRRAQSIRTILINKGVSKEQIAVRSLGDSRPIETNDTPEGRYFNRRVEIRVSP